MSLLIFWDQVLLLWDINHYNTGCNVLRHGHKARMSGPPV